MSLREVLVPGPLDPCRMLSVGAVAFTRRALAGRTLDGLPGRRHRGPAATSEALMVAKRFPYVCAGILCLALAFDFNASVAAAQSGAEPVTIGLGYALMSNGDWYTGDYRYVPMNWTYAGNLFAAAGRALGTQHFVGFAGPGTDGVAAYAITQGGDWYEFGTFHGNIPTIAGRSLGADEFVDIGYDPNFRTWFAITRAGDLFASYRCAAGWCFFGNIFAGSTPALSETWGSVKARHR